MTGGRIMRMALLGLAGGLQAQAPQWPIPGDAFARGEPAASFVQPTASGTPESALFGCVRNDGSRFHEAIDLAPVLPRRRGEAVDPVGAVHSGRVVHLNRIAGQSSYGRYVVLEHPDLSPAVYTLYAHLAAIPEGLEPGQAVAAGQEIGTMGRSAGGYSIPAARAHLHLEIGLRLSQRFQAWYDRQGFSSDNDHGNFNGMNLLGWDPLDYFAAWREGRVDSPGAYLAGMDPGVVLHLRTRRTPDFLERYPVLKAEGCPESERAGWEIFLSPWGLPLSFRPLAEAEISGAREEGDVSVIAVNEAGLAAFACRRIASYRNGQASLESGGRQILELLFLAD